jgi:hypothetical protein
MFRSLAYFVQKIIFKPVALEISKKLRDFRPGGVSVGSAQRRAHNLNR